MRSSIYLLSLIGLGSGFQHPQIPIHRDRLAESSSSDNPLNARFNARVEFVIAKFHVPGLSISVVHGKETYAKGYGFAMLPNAAATPETLYYCASTTKSFTAAAVLKLIENDEGTANPLSLKTKIQSLIRDDFVLEDTYATSHATLEDALSHRTGMAAHDGSYGWPNASLKGVVRNLRNLPTASELREQWQYCNIMYILLSYTVESLSGMWLGHFLRKAFWEPLGMNSTFFSLADAQRAGGSGGPKLAVGYIWDNTTQEYMTTPYVDSPIVSGAGAIISNVLDYAKFLRAMLTMDEKILTRTSFLELRTPRMITETAGDTIIPFWLRPEMYGLGWQISTYRGYRVFSHSGGAFGFAANMLYIPELGNGVGLTLLANGHATSGFIAAILSYELIDEVIGVPNDERIDLESELDFVLRIISRERQPQRQRERSFPDAPTKEDALPLPLPLESYVGEYWNDGYQNLSVRILDAEATPIPWITEGRVLFVDGRERLWRHTTTFEHVSGNYFLGWNQDLRGLPTDISAQAAEFRVGVDGKVQALGLRFEPSVDGKLVWFRKRASRRGC